MKPLMVALCPRRSNFNLSQDCASLPFYTKF